MRLLFSLRGSGATCVEVPGHPTCTGSIPGACEVSSSLETLLRRTEFRVDTSGVGGVGGVIRTSALKGN